MGGFAVPSPARSPGNRGRSRNWRSSPRHTRGEERQNASARDVPYPSGLAHASGGWTPPGRSRHPERVHPGEKYDLAVSETKRIIDAADPEGLLAAGAPPDEYES